MRGLPPKRHVKTDLDTAATLTPTPEQIAKFVSLREKLHALYHKDQFAIHAKVLVWHDALKLKYPNARDYMMFHLVSGSTFKGYSGYFDFDPADSVETFIEREYREAFPLSATPREAV